MKRISLWALTTISSLVLLFGYSTSTSGPTASGPATPPAGVYSSTLDTSGSTSVGSSGSDQTAGSGADPTKTAKPAPTSDTLTGDVVSTRWGPVQVQLIVTGGQITKASVLQYPTGNEKDDEINSYALPILTQETISAQGANIDMVSGATVTSEGYLNSLQSALDQANL